MRALSRRTLLGLFGFAPFAMPAIAEVVSETSPPANAVEAAETVDLVAPVAGRPSILPLLKDGQPIVFYGQDGSLFTAQYLDRRANLSDHWIRSVLLRRETRGRRCPLPPSGLRPGTYTIDDLADALAARRNVTLEAPRQVQSLLIAEPELQPAEGRVEKGQHAVLPGFAGDEGEVALETRLHQFPHACEVPDRVFEVDSVHDLGDLRPVLSPHPDLGSVLVTLDRDDAHA